ncbi:MAG: glycosyltransferase [Erythrobacter sp.]
MQHFVLTRFNVASPGREAPIRNAPGWLSRRFELFTAYCLPSMAGQESRDFHWLIYFDEQTPEQFRERILAAQAEVPFEPIFVGAFHAGLAAEDVAKRLQHGTKRVLTTRLDNDDAVSSDFLMRIRAECEGLPDGTMLNFPHGIALRNGRLYTAVDKSNPFTSLVEQAENAKTIWAAPHTELAKRFPTRQVSTEPCWLQVVHGENVANRIKGKRLGDNAVLNRFRLHPSVWIEDTSPADLLLDRVIFHPIRLLRETIIALAKAILRRH